MKSEKILLQVQRLLNEKTINPWEIRCLLNHVSDAAFFERYDVFSMFSDLLSGRCCEKSVSNYSQMLEFIKNDSACFKRKWAFPLSLTIASKALLSMYLLDNRIATEETISAFLPTAEKLIAENKLLWLKGLTPKEAMRELEELAKFATYQEINCQEDVLRGEYVSFEDVNADDLDMALIAERIDKYLGTELVTLFMNSENDITIKDYAEKLYYCMV